MSSDSVGIVVILFMLVTKTLYLVVCLSSIETKLDKLLANQDLTSKKPKPKVPTNE